MVVRFDDNACALINKNGEPIGTRIPGKLASLHRLNMRLMYMNGYTLTFDLGVVGAELREKQWSKILSLASAHV